MCGFVGVIGVPQAAAVLSIGLQTIQHRGQDAAGIATLHNGRLHLQKDLGLVSAALPPARVAEMPGDAGIGHVRYPTVGGGEREDAQPFLTRRPGIVMAHNGNITNIPELEGQLMERGLRVLSKCDLEPILLVLADELTRLRPAHHTVDDLATAVGQVMKRVRGSFTAVAVLEIDGEESLLAFRDPNGIRPGVYGRRDDGAWLAASESVALDGLGFELVGNIPPGAMLLLRAGKEPVIRQVATASAHHCVFERIYFARPDSIMEDGRVNDIRWRFGEQLAREFLAKGLQADVVVAVPDTSRPAAMAMAEFLGLPNREGFIKNRYSGRTFIMPDQHTRDAALRLKLNPIREVFAGKRVILVDDSIVRGSTMRRIVHMLRDLGPAEVHVTVFSPPVRNPCFYGIDMPSKSELIAAQHDPADLESWMCERFNADSVTYLSLEGLRAVAGDRTCAACFTGDYIVPVSDEERSFILDDRRAS